MTSSDRVVQHYQAGVSDQEGVLRKLSAMVDDMGGGGATVTSSNLANLDQFHVGGFAATIELARRADIHPKMKVLDAGSGLGGPSRYLAEHFGCAFEVTRCDGVTALAREWLPPQQGAAPISGAGIVVGPRMAEMVANFGRNVAEGRVKLVMGLCRAV